MSEELKPVRCGCGGEATVISGTNIPRSFVFCRKCGIGTMTFDTEAEAITAWNKAMGERKTGKWIYDTERVAGDGWTYSQYHCSECKFQEIGGLANFCPHCGADMRGDR